MNVIHRFVVVIHILFLIASKTHNHSSTIKNFAYCQNMLANKTAIHQTIISHITNPLFNTFNVTSLSNVII